MYNPTVGTYADGASSPSPAPRPRSNSAMPYSSAGFPTSRGRAPISYAPFTAAPRTASGGRVFYGPSPPPAWRPGSAAMNPPPASTLTMSPQTYTSPRTYSASPHGTFGFGAVSARSPSLTSASTFTSAQASHLGKLQCGSGGAVTMPIPVVRTKDFGADASSQLGVGRHGETIVVSDTLPNGSIVQHVKTDAGGKPSVDLYKLCTDPRCTDPSANEEDQTMRESMEREMDRLRQDLEKRVDELRQHWGSRYAAVNAQAVGLSAELERVKGELDDARNALLRAEEELAAAHENKRQHSTCESDFAARQTSSDTEIERLRNALTAAEMSKRKLTGRIPDLEAAIERYKLELGRSRGETAAAEEEAAEAVRRLAHWDNSDKEREARWAARALTLENSLRDMANEVSRLQTEAAAAGQLRRDKEELQKENTELSTRLQNAISDLNTCRGELDKYRQGQSDDVNQLQNEISRLRAELQAQRNEVSAGERQLSERSHELAESKDEVAHLRHEIEELKHGEVDHDRLQNEISRLRAELQAQRNEVSELSQQLAESKDEVAHLQREIEELQRGDVDEEMRTSELANQLAALHEEREQERAAYEREMKSAVATVAAQLEEKFQAERSAHATIDEQERLTIIHDIERSLHEHYAPIVEQNRQLLKQVEELQHDLDDRISDIRISEAERVKILKNSEKDLVNLETITRQRDMLRSRVERLESRVRTLTDRKREPSQSSTVDPYVPAAKRNEDMKSDLHKEVVATSATLRHLLGTAPTSPKANASSSPRRESDAEPGPKANASSSPRRESDAEPGSPTLSTF